MGLQKQVIDKCNNDISKYPFDFVICSQHAINRSELYFGNFFLDKTQHEAYEYYYKELYDIIYPNNEVLDKFNFLVLNYVDLILKNSVESKCLAKLRDGLLPKLLSGEVVLGGVIDA